MEFFFATIQRLKYKFGFDRKNFILRYIRSNKSIHILEIGVFNGYFAERLLKTASEISPGSKIYYFGLDLFAEGLTQEKYVSEISLYPNTLIEVQNRLSKISNVEIKLIQGDSTKLVPLIPENIRFDVIHIDGGHSFATVQEDWKNVMKRMDSQTAVFFDDYTNRRGVTKGGFGVKEVVDSIDPNNFKVKLSRNRDYFWKTYGLLSLKMAMVKTRSEQN